MSVNHENYIPSLKHDSKTTQTWTTGTTHAVTDAKCTVRSMPYIMPLSSPTGHLSVVASAGSFTVTSTDDETGLTFKYLLL